MTKYGLSSRILLLLLLALLLLPAAATVQAADITVSGDCSLRGAILAANRNKPYKGCPSGTGPSDRIILTRDEKIYGPLPTVNSNITLEGAGHTWTLGNFTLFDVTSSTLHLKNLGMHYERTRDSDDLLMTVDDSIVTMSNASFYNCHGRIDAKNSSIALYGNSQICGHASGIVYDWFGVAPPDAPPEPSTCEALQNATVTAKFGLRSGIQCQRPGAHGIGVKAVVDGGFLDAVDLWGYVSQGAEICFPQIGSTLFLDSAITPRIAQPLASYRSGDSTCASVDRAGTVALMPGMPDSVAPPSAPAAAPAPATAPPAEGCPIMTTGHLRLRAKPSLNAEILGYVIRGSSLGALSRTTFWYQVQSGGQVGWIGHKYVNNVGNC